MKNKYNFISLLLTSHIILASQQSIIDMSFIDTNNPDLNLSSEEIIKFSKGFKCQLNSDCWDSGICSLETNTCKCYKEFITYFNNILDNHTQEDHCNYKLKKRTTALFYSFFGFGILHFHFGNYLLGIFQLCLFSFTFLLTIYSLVYYSVEALKNSIVNSSKNLLRLTLIVFLNILIFIWWVLDILYILMNVYTDYNGVPFYTNNNIYSYN